MMGRSDEPQTDREWIMKLDASVDSLRQSIEHLAEQFETFEEKRMFMLEERVKHLEDWQSQWGGVYKFIVITVAVLTIVGLIIGFTVRFK